MSTSRLRIRVWAKANPGDLVADVSAEKAALRFCAEKRLVIGSRELEVAIDVAGVAESQIQYLLGIVISSC